MTTDASSSQKVATFSDHLRLEHDARELRRVHHRAEQRDVSTSPSLRISAWERLHGLQLPTEPDHPILLTIANVTKLTMAQIRAEQTARAGTRKSKPDDLAINLSVYAPLTG
jgi:hypothetical protein